jgi:hypothetical protein
MMQTRRILTALIQYRTATKAHIRSPWSILGNCTSSHYQSLGMELPQSSTDRLQKSTCMALANSPPQQIQEKFENFRVHNPANLLKRRRVTAP